MALCLRFSERKREFLEKRRGFLTVEKIGGPGNT